MRAKVLSDEIAYSQNTRSLPLKRVDALSAQAIVTVTTPDAEDFLAGEAEVATLTFDTKANTTAGDYVVVYDTAGDAWAVAADLDGDDAEPTGAIWAAIPAANKAQVDLTSATSAADVAAAFETAFDALTGFTDVITSDDTAADGTMTMTQAVRGPVTNPAVKNADDSGAGSIATAETNAGVASTVDVTNNTITIVGHAFPLGLKGQASSTGTLPAGLATTTDYFVIPVDDDNIQLASTLANAQAGTAIDITDQGTDGATHTFTATSLAGGSIQLQGSNDDSNWVSIGSATNITATGSVLLEDVDASYAFGRATVAITAGAMEIDVIMSGKERPC